MEEKKKKTKKYKIYDADTKAQAVAMVGADRTVDSVAASLGISPHTLGSWVRQAKQRKLKASVTNAQGQSMADLEAEVKRLNQELQYSQRVNRVLKYASSFFLKDQCEADLKEFKK